MSVIKKVTINRKDGMEVRMFPNHKDLTYWDVCKSKDGSGIWYYSMHLSTILDMLYQAGRDEEEVKLQLWGGEDVAIQ